VGVSASEQLPHLDRGAVVFGEHVGFVHEAVPPVEPLSALVLDSDVERQGPTSPGLYSFALSPIVTTAADLDAGLSLFEHHPELGAFDAVLAAVALAHGADALVSADGAFASVPELAWIDPATAAVDSLLDGSASGASASDR
jgi:PIN domain